MKKVIIVLSVALLSTCAFSQKTKPVFDSAAVAQDGLKYVDSLVKHASIEDFRAWLYDRVTAKQFSESKFIDLYNFYVQQNFADFFNRRKLSASGGAK